MTKYLLKRIGRSILSIIMVVLIVMLLIFGLMSRNLIFAEDPVYSKQNSNQRTTYRYRKWEEYGYLDYVPFNDYLVELVNKGELDAETQTKASAIGKKASDDKGVVVEYVKKFTDFHKAKGYEVIRLPYSSTKGGGQQLFAVREKPLISRLFNYFSSIVAVDSIHYATGDVGERGLTFTWNDPVYTDGRFSPAIIGNGTKHQYLLYFDDKFPYLHQNLVTISLGKSNTVNQGVDVFDTMTKSQGSLKSSTVTFPTGLTEESADDLHSATYLEGSRESSLINVDRFTSDYANVITHKKGMSKIGYSFSIGIIASVMAYLIGIPLGIAMARRKEKFIDKLGTLYIIFMIAVPSLAYIFMFKAIGRTYFKLPTTFDMDSSSKLMYVLPIVSLTLPSVANLMKWIRRYMIDQMNSDYVKFARSGGLTEGDIFKNHILKNAIIPIVHGIPGTLLFAMVGAIITERVYVVPGAGNLLTVAINTYDNDVIVGVTMFYAVLSVTALILGDVLMALVDPRITFTEKAR